MSKNLFTLVFISFIGLNSISAQQFVNGSLEPMSSVSACINLTDSTFNAVMGGSAYSFGVGTSNLGFVYFNNASCADTMPELGNYCVAMGWVPGQAYSQIALKLNSPMTAGQNYQLSFWNSASAYHSPANMWVGYSWDSSQFGTAFGTVNAPSFTNIGWTQHIYTFSPTVACSWITLKTVNSTVLPAAPTVFSFVDNFSLSIATGISKVNAGNDNSITLFPNPAGNEVFMQLDKVAWDENLNVEIYDIKGRAIIHRVFNTSANTGLDLSNVPEGMYVVKIYDSRQSAIQKLMVSK